MTKHIGEAIWNGGLKEGKGKISVESGAFQADYDFSSRFEEGHKSNPEEILGAAHAACFSMALAGLLEKDGFQPEEIKTRDHVKMEKQKNGFVITEIHIETQAIVSGMKKDEFQKKADEAKKTCIISQALSGIPMTLSATLEKEEVTEVS